MALTLSLLDLVPLRTGQTSAQAVAASMQLVRRADELGVHRYWFAEHHNMPAIASSSPPVLIAAAASRTERVRLGSGGVMLPNHSPLIVAEQFSTLAALAPGRIDLGIGRAPGSDQVITQLLRQSGATSDVDRFPDNIKDIIALSHPDGANLRFASGGEYTVRATPVATSTPEVWLLGSSDYSARLAAQLGLPYVFANHFAGDHLDHAMSLYRTQYRPSAEHPEPKSFLTANAVVAPTHEEAFERALPHLRMMARMRSNKPLRAAETVDEVRANPSDEAERRIIDHQARNWFIGEPDDVAKRLRAFAAEHGVDEIMISAAAGQFESEPLDESTGRIQTVELLTAALRR
ncbi:LLM class flavin-dependent oxidoreductase [Nocardia jiangsuensis]|uniref:LLM class flavin-dependent oxidoreductase n=1 Tax=Nocardia jiangsuensis TaxID=1691563 RepID=A0ABV8DZZ5_9NOCA